MFVNNLDPVFIQLGPISIYWYGIVYALGFVGAYYALTRWTKLNEKQSEQLLLYLGIGMLVGSRLTYYLVYANGWSLIDIFKIWDGGMSFHGALAGMGLAAYLWQRRYNINLLPIMDALAIVAAFFLALGRIANFFNSEIVGTISSLPWCVEYPNAATGYQEGCRHPVQLYATLKNLFIGTVLYVSHRKKHAEGFVFWLFVTLYGILRFLVSFLRAEDARVLLGLGWGHIFSLVMIAVGGYILVTRYKTDSINLIKRARQ